jgi:hypothetical protein
MCQNMEQKGSQPFSLQHVPRRDKTEYVGSLL